MKKIFVSSFIILSFFIPLNSWALPACQSDQSDYYHNCFGTYNFESGDKYVGEWKDDKRNGKGTNTFPDGEKYEGEWLEGEKHGQGTYIWKDEKSKGQKYVGYWKNNRMHGKGNITLSNGDRYSGDFKYDKYDGEGTYFYNNGRKQEGIWKDGFFQYEKKLDTICKKQIEQISNTNYEVKNKIIKRLAQKGWETDKIIKCLNRLIK